MITSALIKELRESTGVGMMDCKKALTESNGDLEKAKDWLREKGFAKAAKKAGRAAAQGLVLTNSKEKLATIIEVNSETDFVAKNPKFQEFAISISDYFLENDGDLEKVLTDKNNELTEQIAHIGENIQIRRGESISGDVVSSYTHAAMIEKAGKIGVILAVNGIENSEENKETLKKIAMHIAASNPIFAKIEEVDAETLEKEKSFFAKDAEKSGKPANIIEKMMVGRVRKYYEEVVLEEQNFVMDTSKKVKDIIKSMGENASLVGFKKLVLGEGVEKVEENLAEEIAKMNS